MQIYDKIKNIKNNLNSIGVDGWLFYDFRRSNDLACKFLEIPPERMLTRRFFYWIPAKANLSPIKLVHQIEDRALEHLPGEVITYSSWEKLEQSLKIVLKGSRKVAMEYSPHNAIPYVSKVDAGTVELVRSFGIEVVSSENLLQQYTSVWDQLQLASHMAAGRAIEEAVSKAWHLIFSSIAQNKMVTEWDVQALILNEFKRLGCVCEDPPMCAINANSANPHYTLERDRAALIKSGDIVLIDLWCKQSHTGAVYADITRMGFVGKEPSQKYKEIFGIVKNARDAAMQFLRQRLEKGESIMGYEVDAVCREVIVNAGYGKYFTHRTGHNIGERDHGDGANIDSFETKDTRFLLPGTCFSIEPGIYLPGEFGVRLEHDVYIDKDGRNLLVTGLQEEIVCG